MKTLFKVKFSEKGSNVRAMEEQTYVFFVDFMDECEGMHDYNYYDLMSRSHANIFL
jgi:hypothetical protein